MDRRRQDHKDLSFPDFGGGQWSAKRSRLDKQDVMTILCDRLVERMICAMLRRQKRQIGRFSEAAINGLISIPNVSI